MEWRLHSVDQRLSILVEASLDRAITDMQSAEISRLLLSSDLQPSAKTGKEVKRRRGGQAEFD